MFVCVFFFLIKLYLGIMIDTHTIVKNNIKISLVVTFCKTIVQYHNQHIDTDTVQVHIISSNARILQVALLYLHSFLALHIPERFILMCSALFVNDRFPLIYFPSF